MTESNVNRWSIGGRAYTRSVLNGLLQEASQTDRPEFLNPPWPDYDLPPQPGVTTLVQRYSSNRLAFRVGSVYTAALQGYGEFVTTWFS
jgi:hypothetical protein